MQLTPKRLTTRLYLAGLLLLATVVVPAVGSWLYVRHTERVAKEFHDKLENVVRTLADASMLVERHRRIIETAPVEVDRSVLARNELASTTIITQILVLTDTMPGLASSSLLSDLAELEFHASTVLRYANEFAQDEALRAANDYSYVAGKVQNLVQGVRSKMLQASNADVAALVTRGAELQNGITLALVLALALVAPLALGLIRHVARRIDAITAAMRRISANDIGVAVPSLGDRDEIGDMARALRIFQRNAVALSERSKEVETLNARFELALDNMARGLSMFDAQGRLIVCNRLYATLYDLAPEVTVTGTPLVTISAYCRAVNDEGADRTNEPGDLSAWFARFMALIRAGRPFSETHKLSNGRTVVVHVQPLADGGWVDVHEDVTEKIVAEARITQLANFDELTGLANRHHFLGLLSEGLDAARSSECMTVLWLDLDRFKGVNDALGHPVGDALLAAVADRLRAAVRKSDVVARLGGDEFAILATGEGMTEAGAITLGHRLTEVLARPFHIMGHSVSIGASVGIAIGPRDGRTPEELLKNADIALYRAKTAGRGTLVMFEPAFEASILERHRLEEDLRAAVDNGELLLFYQPILDLKQRRVTSCEALMRWKHPVRGMVSPAVFIPVAEDIGLISDFGAWALKQACADAATWPDGIKVAVNLSAQQFQDSKLTVSVLEAVCAANLSPWRLELEVTESLLLSDSGESRATLQSLRDAGIGIALDDFGTGYASLSYLRQFPFTKLKIDQSFVRDLPNRSDCVAIVRAVTDLARSLHMTTVAEGIETLEHLAQVTMAGCDEGQGYLFSRPVPASHLPDVIASCAANAEERAA